MSKRMLIDDTQPEETRVVIVDGNKVEDVEFESTSRKQIKGNIYTAKVVRVEPSLQAAFIDYGGNKHGFLAFSEIHPDYYNVSDELLASIDKEVDEIIENKKQYIKERREQRARYRAEKKAQYEARKAEEERLKALEEQQNEEPKASEPIEEAPQEEAAPQGVIFGDSVLTSEAQENTESETPVQTQEESEPVAEAQAQSEDGSQMAEDSSNTEKRRRRPYRSNRRRMKDGESAEPEAKEKQEDFKVLSAQSVDEDDKFDEGDDLKPVMDENDNDSDDDIDIDISDNTTDAEFEYSFEVQRKLIRARKLYHNSNIQDVIKEGQILLVQVVKEERGNKGASFTTYLSLAGRYGVLMPNRIKSGGVSRKITNAADRKRLKDIIKTLPLSMDMSLIIRTAGEDKTEEEIVRDYNYLIRTWNLIRLNALQNKAPSLVYEEGDLIKRALRDMCSNDIAEIIVDGDAAYKAARDFVKILSPQSLRKLKCRKPNETPVFQRYQIEAQLDKLHNPIVQLESGGYLVINPTEALVAIDVNSGRATKEMDIEETALKTNLEAADEIARQLKMRDLAGLVVVDFIDMDDPKNNIAVEKRMKEALKTDRARVQIARMSCFGLLEISRQRMHSSFVESNYEPCPYCHGQGVMRTTESGAVLILRAIEEEGIKNRFTSLTVSVPTDTAVYLLNQKRKNLADLEERYNMSVVISADNSIKNVSDYKIERLRQSKVSEPVSEAVPATTYSDAFVQDEEDNDEASVDQTAQDGKTYSNRRFNRRRGRFDRRRRDNQNNLKEAPVILYSSDDINVDKDQTQKKTTWWRKLIG
ncbi:MAG: Rne/Rng family ribonuclease [Alphaproteobacteria bacterium]|nr:Rne/Rng family ribonuclease [Alphaproteobacteria bacterium]